MSAHKSTLMAEKAILKAQKDADELAEEYGVPRSAVLWMGDNKYAVVKDGETVFI